MDFSNPRDFDPIHNEVQRTQISIWNVPILFGCDANKLAKIFQKLTVKTL